MSSTTQTVLELPDMSTYTTILVQAGWEGFSRQEWYTTAEEGKRLIFVDQLLVSGAAILGGLMVVMEASKLVLV